AHGAVLLVQPRPAGGTHLGALSLDREHCAARLHTPSPDHERRHGRQKETKMTHGIRRMALLAAITLLGAAAAARAGTLHTPAYSSGPNGQVRCVISNVGTTPLDYKVCTVDQGGGDDTCDTGTLWAGMSHTQIGGSTWNSYRCRFDVPNTKNVRAAMVVTA